MAGFSTDLQIDLHSKAIIRALYPIHVGSAIDLGSL
jgi:hypothetical protein